MIDIFVSGIVAIIGAIIAVVLLFALDDHEGPGPSGAAFLAIPFGTTVALSIFVGMMIWG